MEKLLELRLQDPEVHRLRGSTLESLFGRLARHKDAVGHQRVVRLEWNLFPVMGFEADMPTLHQFILDEPAFFVELVQHAFRPESSTEDEQDDAAELQLRREQAARAYEVLGSLRRCPGVGDDGELDEITLRNWIVAARSGLAEIDRKKVGDQQIGKILANAPAPSGELRIGEVIRKLVDELDSDDVDHGLEMAIYCERGFTSRGVFDGGEQERSIAQKFVEESSTAGAWPRSRKLLRRLADRYESDGRRNDLSAERRHHGLGQ